MRACLILIALANGVTGFVHLKLPIARRQNDRIISSLKMATTPMGSAPKPHRKPIALKHLFRHYDDISMDCFLRCAEPHSFLLSCGYSAEEIDALAKDCPALLEKDVHDHLAPHIRFLVKALGGGSGDLMWQDVDANTNFGQDDKDEECQVEDEETEKHQLVVSDLAKQVVPASFFQLRLEKPLAPWHAYLAWKEELPSGNALLQDDGTKLRQFLKVCKSGKMSQFVDLCNEWDTVQHRTADEISEFQFAFQEGLVPAVRNHLHGQIDCDPGQMVEILLSHGANHLEDDHHGASLLHWAAGTGNWRAVQALVQAGKEDGIPVEEIVAMDHTAKDGATPLHWAASGVTPQGVFGSGGHPEICRHLLDLSGKDLTEETTYTHNSPLEWAAWAGSLEVVKLFVEDYGADVHFCSENGNAAHWACAGGSLEVCQYLSDNCSVDFCLPNEARGWTPLDLATSEGHKDVAEWVLNKFYSDLEKDKKRESMEASFDEVSKEMQKQGAQSSRQA